MTDEIGISAKLGGLLPADQMKDSGGDAPGQEILLRKRKKRREDKPVADTDQEDDGLDRERVPSSGKIVDIVI
jgi:hypothetical protein